MNNDIKILVIDDEEDFRQLMKMWLESKGYSVVTAPDGATGIQMVKSEKPGIVFVDLRMPGMDGSETISGIRSFDKRVPIIIISSYVSDLKMKEVISAGISGVFYKDQDFEKGSALLDAALRTHKKLK
ncbi:MAG TPA: response regulator [Candidatus Omnitrophota bacterium]|nr:response regulator [Candidatus Omnitrophota bacterium]